MKKLLLFALALNFVACSTDSTDQAASAAVNSGLQENTFNPNPNPEDYRIAKDPNFVKDEKKLVESEKSSLTNKTAEVWVRTYVPDAHFRTALFNNGAGIEDNVVGDNYINIDQSRIGLNVQNAQIADATGIQAFTNLQQLLINDNQLTTLNVSAITNLSWIECQYNSLTSLNFSSNTNLSQIWCHNNLLTSLTLPANDINLWGLWCYSNSLSTLSLNGNVKFTSLFVQGNNLTSLATSGITTLQLTNVSSNKWVTLDFNLNTALTNFWCYSNTLLTDINVKNGNNFFMTVDFSGNTKHPKIHVDFNFLSSAQTTWTSSGGSIYIL